MSQASISKARIIVCVTNEEAFVIIRDILADVGERAERTTLGRETIARCSAELYRLVVLDVATADMYAFEVVAALKALPAGQAPYVILLPSVYDRTQYKRKPTSLYGADDYIEQHHLPDKLPLVIRRLLTMPMGTVVTPPNHELVAARRARLRRAADETLAQGSGSLLDRARALARRVVLDLSFYDEPGFRAGLDHNNLPETMKVFLADATTFLGERLPTELQGNAQALIEEALRELDQSRGGER